MTLDVSEYAGWYGLDEAELLAETEAVLASGEIDSEDGERTYNVIARQIEVGGNEFTLPAGYQFGGTTAAGLALFVKTGMTQEERETTAMQIAVQKLAVAKRDTEIDANDAISSVEQALADARREEAEDDD
jgi:hypothetical protein